MCETQDGKGCGKGTEWTEPRRGMKRGNGFAEVLRSFGGSEPLFWNLDVLKIFVTILVAVVKIRIHIRPAIPKLQDTSPTRVVSTWCRSLHKRLQPVLETMRPVLDTQGLEVHPLPACGVSLPCSWPVLCRWPWPAPGQQSVCVKGAAWRLKSEL